MKYLNEILSFIFNVESGITILILILVIYLSNRYLTEGFNINTKIADYIYEKPSKVILIAQYGVPFYCRIRMYKQVFLIKAKTVCLSRGKFYLVYLMNDEEIPDSVRLKFGTFYENTYIFKFPKKIIEKTEAEFRIFGIIIKKPLPSVRRLFKY